MEHDENLKLLEDMIQEKVSKVKVNTLSSTLDDIERLFGVYDKYKRNFGRKVVNIDLDKYSRKEQKIIVDNTELFKKIMF